MENQLLDLGAESEYRFQKIEVTVPANAVVDTATENNVQLDRDFNKIIGIGFFEELDGGIANLYNVGARTQRQTWIDPILIGAWRADNGVAPMEKFFKVNIPFGSGDTFYARIQNSAVNPTILKGQMVLVLVRDLTEMPK